MRPRPDPVLPDAEKCITISYMTTITCKMSDRLAAEVEALARCERRSKSALIREALEERLRTARRKTTLHAYDLVKPLCGALRGPRDLSTHPRHMEGFGA